MAHHAASVTAAVRQSPTALRAWQERALVAMEAWSEGPFLISAAPGAGKTRPALEFARRQLKAGAIRRVAVVCPTTPLTRQWAAAAARMGLHLVPDAADLRPPADFCGVAVTYARVAASAARWATQCTPGTLVIADEAHHLGEELAWGEGFHLAFGRARRRLLLSGTPFRSDNTAIPWVAYDDDGVSSADHAYTYTDALIDGVCRPITFLAYGGEMEWVSDGKTRTAEFETFLPRQESARRLRTALDAGGDWIAQVLRDADERLEEVRADGHPTAGALVVAADKEHANALADRLSRITGRRPPVVTSDDPGASDAIDRFAGSDERWLVSVLMVSEGVDIPRLRVGVYATPARTELFFRQVVGRFVRRTPRPARQMSYLLMPADPDLKLLAAAVEEERRHALEQDESLEERDQPVERAEAGDGFTALSSNAHLEDVISSTTAPGDALLLFADEASPQMATSAPVSATPAEPEEVVAEPAPEAAFQKRRRLRDERAALVSKLARRGGGDHRSVNAWVNRAVGVTAVADATADQLQRSITVLENELRR